MELSIIIKEKEYKIKQSFRTYLLFEERNNKQISEIQTMKDMLELLYCSFVGCNKNFEYDFDEFLDLLDENPDILTKFNEFNLKNNTVNTEKKSPKKV